MTIALDLTRTFDAPMARVFACFTDPQEMSAWLGPYDHRGEVLEMDARVGGRFRIAMHKPDGSQIFAGGAYQAAIARLRPGAAVRGVACSLFVALAEEGWTHGAIPEAIAQRYLGELFADRSDAPDTLVAPLNSASCSAVHSRRWVDPPRG